MKRFAPLTLIAATALVLAGCSAGTTADPEPEPPATQAESNQQDTQAESPAEPSGDELEYLEALLPVPVSEQDLLEAGHNACGQIQLSKGIGNETVTGEDIKTAVFSTMQHFARDPDDANIIVRESVYKLCPEYIEQFDYEAMRSGPFYDDFTEERKAMHEE